MAELPPLEQFRYSPTVPNETKRIKFCAKAGCPADQCIQCSKRKQSFQEKLRASLIQK